MTIPDRINDFLVEIREHNGFASDKDFDRVAAEVFKQKIKGLIEECAQIADRQAAGFQVLIDHAPTPIRAEDMKRVKHSAEIVAKEIRKLTESEP